MKKTITRTVKGIEFTGTYFYQDESEPARFETETAHFRGIDITDLLVDFGLLDGLEQEIVTEY